jgi:hypothetical protein
MHPLHIWIFNDASIAFLLRPDSPLWADFTPGVLVELADRPTLAHAFDLETPANYPGAAGLLGTTTTPADLVVRLATIPTPTILAPSQPLTPATAIAALRRLAPDTRIEGPRVVLLDAALAPAITPALAYATRLGIAWDLSTPPGRELPRLLDALSAESLVRPETWAGLIGYFSPDHAATPEEYASASAAFAALPAARVLAA